MKRTGCFLALSFLILSATARVGAAADKTRPRGKNATDVWLEATLGGEKIGCFNAYDVEIPYQGRTVHYSAESSTMRAKRGDDVFSSTDETVSWYELDGRLIRSSRLEKDGDQTTTRHVEVKGDILTVTKTLNDKEEKTQVKIPKDVKVTAGAEGWTLKPLGFQPGKTHEFTVFSESTMKLEKETATAVGREKYQYEGKLVDAYVFTSTRTDMPGVKLRMLLAPDFLPLKGSIGPLEMQRVSREQAVRFAKAATDLWRPIPVNGSIPAWTELDRMTLRLRVQHDKGGKLVKTTPYVRVLKSSPGEYELELRSVMPPKESSEQLPVKADGKEVKTCLEPALMFQSDHPEIRALATQVVGKEKNALRAAAKLCAWVYHNLGKESPKTASASALETLRSKKGDCSEHAALLCALARAAGIPAREADGLTFRGEDLGFHAWTEVYIGGHWIPLDATIDFVGLPAGSLRLGTLDGKTSRGEYVALLVSLMGKTQVDVVSATRHGDTFDPRDPKQAISVTKDLYNDKLNDFSLDLRGGSRRTGKWPAVQFVTPENLFLTINPMPVVIHDDKLWETFVAEFCKSIRALSPKNVVKKQETLPNSSVYILTFDGEIKKVRLGYELRLYTVARRTLMVMVTAQKRIFEKNRAAVKKVFERVTVGKTKAETPHRSRRTRAELAPKK